MKEMSETYTATMDDEVQYLEDTGQVRKTHPWQSEFWTRHRKVMVGVLVFVFLVSLGVGLGLYYATQNLQGPTDSEPAARLSEPEPVL